MTEFEKHLTDCTLKVAAGQLPLEDVTAWIVANTEEVARMIDR